MWDPGYGHVGHNLEPFWTGVYWDLFSHVVVNKGPKHIEDFCWNLSQCPAMLQHHEGLQGGRMNKVCYICRCCSCQDVYIWSRWRGVMVTVSVELLYNISLKIPGDNNVGMYPLWLRVWVLGLGWQGRRGLGFKEKGWGLSGLSWPSFTSFSTPNTVFTGSSYCN